jgi:hypothetical protein
LVLCGDSLNSRHFKKKKNLRTGRYVKLYFLGTLVKRLSISHNATSIASEVGVMPSNEKPSSADPAMLAVTEDTVADAVSVLYFFVNGKEYNLQPGTGFKPEQTLLNWLRERGYTGTKLGCGEGGCGACTLSVSHFDKVLTVPRSPSLFAT